MKKYKHSIFKGTAVGIDKVDLKNEYSVDCWNVNLNKLGELQSMLGMSKQNSSELQSGNQIMVVHQLDLNEYVVANGIVTKM